MLVGFTHTAGEKVNKLTSFLARSLAQTGCSERSCLIMLQWSIMRVLHTQMPYTVSLASS